jgi:hypothetical protein
MMPMTRRSVNTEGMGRLPKGRFIPRMSIHSKGPAYVPNAGLPAFTGDSGAVLTSLVYKRHLRRKVYHPLRLQNSHNRSILDP